MTLPPLSPSLMSSLVCTPTIFTSTITRRMKSGLMENPFDLRTSARRPLPSGKVHARSYACQGRDFFPPGLQSDTVGAGRANPVLPNPKPICLYPQMMIHAGGGLLVWNAQNPEPLLREAGHYWHPSMTFSDGRFFACSTSRQEVCLWKESPSGYIRIGKHPSGAPCSIPLLSQDGESIIIFGGPTIQLWHTKGFTTPSTPGANLLITAETLPWNSFLTGNWRGSREEGRKQ